MILFSSVKLEKALANDTLDSWGKTKYLIAIAITMSLGSPIYLLTPSFGPKPSLVVSAASEVSGIAVIILTFFGIRKCYRTNMSIDDTEFIARYTALYVPMILKFMILMIPAFLIAFTVAFWLSSEAGKVADRSLITLYSLLPFGIYLFYVFLNRSFERLGRMIDK